jgi:hypothetical protein
MTTLKTHHLISTTILSIRNLKIRRVQHCHPIQTLLSSDQTLNPRPPRRVHSMTSSSPPIIIVYCQICLKRHKCIWHLNSHLSPHQECLRKHQKQRMRQFPFRHLLPRIGPKNRNGLARAARADQRKPNLEPARRPSTGVQLSASHVDCTMTAPPDPEHALVPCWMNYGMKFQLPSGGLPINWRFLDSDRFRERKRWNWQFFMLGNYSNT